MPLTARCTCSLRVTASRCPFECPRLSPWRTAWRTAWRRLTPVQTHLCTRHVNFDRRDSRTSSMTVLTAGSSPAQLESLLLQLTVPDTAAVRAATAALKPLLNKVSSVPALLCILSTSQQTAARQLSSVYLRKKVGAHWGKLKAQDRVQCQAILIERLATEPERVVKNAIAGVVTVVAKYSLPSSSWPQLLPSLETMARGQDPTMREIAIRVFRILLGSIGKTMRAHLPVLRVLFQAALDDADVSVRLEALKALSSLVSFLTDPASLAWFQSVLGSILAALSACVTSDEGNAEAAVAAIDVLEELADDPKDVLGGRLVDIVQSILAIAADSRVEMDIRERCASMISSVVDHRAASILESPALIDQLINGSMTILLESCNAAVENGADRGADDDDEEDEHSGSCRGMAVQILDQIMLNLPDSVVYPRVMSAVTTFMRHEAGGAAWRRAALFALMVSVEGAASAMRSDFDSILSVVLQGLHDVDTVVREAACLAIGQLSDHMTSSMTPDHVRRVMHAIVHCLDQPTSTLRVKRKLCLAIEAICTEVDQGTCNDYIGALVQRLFTLVRANGDDISLLEASLNALAAVAKNAGKEFAPYFNDTIQLVHAAMSSSDEAHEPLRGAAMRCAGAVLLATGETTPCEPLMQLSLAAFQSATDPSLRESAFHFWSLIAQLLQSSFQPYLQTVVQLALDAIESEDGMNFRSTKADLNAEFGGHQDEDEDESLGEDTIEDGDCIDDSDAESPFRCSILSGYLDEKVAAADCLTSICRCTGPIMVPLIKPIQECFELLAEYPHENMRLVALKGLHDLTVQVGTLYPSQGPTPSEEARTMIDATIPILVIMVTDDESRDVVASGLDALLSVITTFKGDVFNDHLPDIVRCITQVLQSTIEADKYPLADTEKDSILDSCCDLIGGLPQALSTEVSVAMVRELWAPLGTRFSQGDALTQALIIGALGEAVDALQGAMPSDIAVLPIAMQALASDHCRLRRNAAFCAGACFAASGIAPQDASRFSSVLLDLLAAPIPVNDDHAMAAVDNVCSALCKLVAGPSRCTFDPLRVFEAVIGACPLKVDMDECRPVYTALATALWTNLPPQARSGAAAHALVSKCAAGICQADTDEVKSAIAAVLQPVLREVAADVNLAALSPEEQDVCRRLMQC